MRAFVCVTEVHGIIFLCPYHTHHQNLQQTTIICKFHVTQSFSNFHALWIWQNTFSQRKTCESLHSLFSEVIIITLQSKCTTLTISNPIFLPPAYSPALIYFGWERGRWITCNYYPTVLKEENRNRSRKSITCAICWLKSILHEEKHREQENHVRRGLT
jgi:predicted XRE-type DNA-binding protein